MTSDPTKADTRPGCATTTGARSPQPYLDRLTAAVARLNTARSLSRQLRALADDALTITNEQLADRLAALADRATTPSAGTGVLCEAGAGEGVAHRAGLPV